MPGGRELLTLRDAADYITALPKAEHDFADWQVAMEVLLLVAERDGRGNAGADCGHESVVPAHLVGCAALIGVEVEVGRWPTTGPTTIGVSVPSALGPPESLRRMIRQVLDSPEIYGLLSRWLAAHRQRRDARFLLRRSGRGVVKVRATDAPLRILRELVPAALRASAVLFVLCGAAMTNKRTSPHAFRAEEARTGAGP